MAYHLSNMHTAAHYWANQTQERGKAGNVFFESGIIYSYGYHFAIARHLSPGVVVLSTNTYSLSTGRHQSVVRGAVNHLKRVYVPDARASAECNRRAVLGEIEAEMVASRTTRRIRQTTRDGHVAEALRLAERFNEYLAVEPNKGKARPIPVDTEVWARDAEKLARAKAREAAKREKERVARLEALKEKHAEMAEQWRAGKNIPYYEMHQMPVMLRLDQDRGEIETSQGARVPISVAPWVYLRAKWAKDNGQSYTSGTQVKLGVYGLTAIRNDGTVIVGCHTIPYAEIERMATVLGLQRTADVLQSIAI